VSVRQWKQACCGSLSDFAGLHGSDMPLRKLAGVDVAMIVLGLMYESSWLVDRVFPCCQCA